MKHFSGKFWLQLVGIILVMLMTLPLFYLVIRASQDPQAGWQYIRSELSKSVLNTIQLTIAVGIAAALLGIPLAWLTVRTDLKGRRIWTILCTLPLVIPSYVGAFAFIAALGPRGMFQSLFGIERLPEIRGFFGAWLSITLFTFPYVFLSVRAGLLGLDPQLEEASRILGKGSWTTFHRITLPHLFPSIQAGVLLAMLYALSDFGAVAFMRYNAFTRVIFRRYLISPEQTAALALFLVLLAILFLSLSRQYNTRTYYRRSTKLGQQVVPLGKWQFFAQLFCGMVVSIALVIPTGVVVYWLINGLQEGHQFNEVLGPMQRSMRISALTAVAAGVVALPLVFIQVRYPSRLSRLLRTGAYLGYSIPGVVVAISLIYFALRLDSVLKIYQTFPLLIFALLVRFLPQMLGPLGTSLLQVNPHLEESAAILGGGRVRVLLTITLPLIRSGWIAGAALVFLTVMKELPVTLILAPTGYNTLATEIWSATAEAFYARAAVPALVMLIVSALSLIYILEPDNG